MVKGPPVVVLTVSVVGFGIVVVTPVQTVESGVARAFASFLDYLRDHSAAGFEQLG